MPFTLRNLKEDLEDVGSNFDGAPDLEFRLATKALGLEQSGLGYQRIPPGYRFPYGHTHEKQEEVYVVLRGSGRMKLDDEIVELEAVGRGARPARHVARLRGRAARALRSSSSARPTSARLRATTSRAGATGGLTSAGRVSAESRESPVRAPGSGVVSLGAVVRRGGPVFLNSEHRGRGVATRVVLGVRHRSCPRLWHSVPAAGTPTSDGRGPSTPPFEPVIRDRFSPVAAPCARGVCPFCQL